MALLIINILHHQCQMQHIINNTKVDNTTNTLNDTNFTLTTELENRKNCTLPPNMDKAKLGNSEFDFPEQKEIDDAVLFGLEKMHDLYFVEEPKLYKMGLYLKKNHPGHTLGFFRTYNEKSLEFARYGYASVQASSKIAQLRAESKGRDNPVPMPFLRSSLLLDKCPLQGLPICPKTFERYRTVDGSCNNLDNLWFGASMLPMHRLLPPSYNDGVQTVRQSVLGGHLPSARQISVKIHKDKNREMETLTLMFMQWGQFLDHDIIFSAQARMFNRSVPQCCQDDGSGFLQPDLTHPECLPIPVSEDDWFFGKFGIRCMEFVRSAPTSRIDCDLGWREQISQVTAFIDGSNIYGSDVDISRSVRLFRKGQIAYGRSKRKGPLQPPDPPGGELCRKGAITSDCFQSGDFRVNDQPGLTALHTVWLRYHNQLALELSKLNPHWSDEKIFQETRRIIGATIQHITYKEFLPIVLGEEVIQLFNLNLLNRGYYKGYNSKINPAPTSAFGAAAFRFGHSLVQNSFVRTDSSHRAIRNNVTLHEEQQNFENIWSFGSLDRLILGLSNQPSQKRDEFITSELTNHLFQLSDFQFGMDLAAINIQRGRDHGLPSYTSWREPCGLNPIRNWTDLEKVISKETVKQFKGLYAHFDDIDLFSGGLAEKPVRGGIVGPTFACIIAQQFLNLRRGDRFWYENGNFESSFTPAQLQQIRQTTFAHVLCKTLSEVKTLQLFVFLASDNLRNSRFPCESILENLKLDAWEEVLEEDREIFLDLKEVEKEVDELESRIDLDLFKKVRRRTTTTRKPQKTKKTYKRPVTTTTPANNYKPFKVKLTNVTTTILGSKKKLSRPSGSNYIETEHNQYPNKIPSVPQSSYNPSKPLTVLDRPSINGYLVNYADTSSPNPIHSISGSSVSPINVNINIQLIPTKQDGDKHNSYQYDYKLQHNNNNNNNNNDNNGQKPTSPQPIYVLNKYNQNNNQQHQYNNYPSFNSYTTKRPLNNFYAKYTYDQYGNLNIVSEKAHIKPLYGYSTSPTIFESIPFATSSRPHTENNNGNDFYNNESTRKPIIIPSYLFLNENTDEDDDFKDLIKPSSQQTYSYYNGQGLTDNDKDKYDRHPDFNADIPYLHMLHVYKDYSYKDQQQDSNNDHKFIKISSIQGQKYISNKDIHKPILFSIKQREGDLDLSSTEQNTTTNSPLFKINIFPSEIRTEKWKIYNETNEDFIAPSIFDLIYSNISTPTSDELPRPIVVY